MWTEGQERGDEIDPARLDAICARFGLEGDDRWLVCALLERPERRWPGCCGSGCTPCMKDVKAAARALRAESRGRSEG
ncbi:MAG TPA: hypothetical protein RMH85_33215 [Polyangiaceae bacterium LLY-WYZ-15_(1-7)]|nr:hypothetical protein [Myxococcales bacterium]MAT25114.1 hypothetical protein [Sandaracinus sp.]HJL01913.1 hypothetical protein [Polyangiaceae bacterium LLY-WYZ-15_(1-7)]MBJ70563.1 hypothetical protein [Sandaracinus sp.]HJL13390.1 hypothetical protein [Polyangiaceae bacterium LLY-WYZ-15_(1-7)]